jgi:fatty acid desaturase
MNWHIEHHMYAAVPCYNLRKLNELVADDMPEPRTLIGAWKEMRQIWRKQEQDQNYQFDTKVPDLQKKHNSFEDPLISSIGDLAPHSLR